MRATKRIVRDLLELIAAIDRRAPQTHRAGEASIAVDAAALRARAVERLHETVPPARREEA